MNFVTESLKNQGLLYLDRSSSRLALNGDEFHCGDSVEVFIYGQWRKISLEYFKEWYTFLDGKRIGQKELIGIPARC
nr:DUF5348 domain-containing protein [uncultured Dialister sp.]